MFMSSYELYYSSAIAYQSNPIDRLLSYITCRSSSGMVTVVIRSVFLFLAIVYLTRGSKKERTEETKEINVCYFLAKA